MQYWRSSPQPFDKEQSQKKRRLSYRIELVFERRDRPFPAALETSARICRPAEMGCSLPLFDGQSGGSLELLVGCQLKNLKPVWPLTC